MTSARDLQGDLERLVGAGKGFTPLDPLPARGARAGSRSLGTPGGAPGGGGGDPGDVENFELTSSDGLFVLQLRTETLPSGNKALIAPPEEEEEEGGAP